MNLSFVRVIMASLVQNAINPILDKWGLEATVRVKRGGSRAIVSGTAVRGEDS